jgi:hypothetical protein
MLVEPQYCHPYRLEDFGLTELPGLKTLDQVGYSGQEIRKDLVLGRFELKGRTAGGQVADSLGVVAQVVEPGSRHKIEIPLENVTDHVGSPVAGKIERTILSGSGGAEARSAKLAKPDLIETTFFAATLGGHSSLIVEQLNNPGAFRRSWFCCLHQMTRVKSCPSNSKNADYDNSPV